MAQYKDLVPVTNLFEVRGGKTTDVSVNFVYGTVVLNSQPSGATVRSGTNVLGPTPLTLLQRPGAVTYELDLTDYDITKVPVTVEARGRNSFNPQLRSIPKVAGEATVSIKSDPPGASIFLNGAYLAEAPTKTRAPAGKSVQLSAKYKNWPTKTINLMVAAAGENVASFYFERGNIRFQIVPDGAFVWLGTNRFGPTPASSLVPTGALTFRIECPGYDSTERKLTVTDQAELTLLATLVTTNGILEFTSDPAPAQIVDAKSNMVLGMTTAKGILRTNVAPNQYVLTAHINGLKDVSLTASVPKGTPTKLHFPFDYGDLLLSSDPPGAEFYDTSDMKLQLPVRLPPGPFQLIAKHRALGLRDQPAAVLVANHATTSTQIVFYCDLRITSTPEGATIFENGRSIGTTPHTNKTRLGHVAYKLEWGGKGTNLDANLTGSSYTLSAQFEEPGPKTRRNTVGMELVLVPAPIGYWVGKYEVKQSEYLAVMGSNPSFFTNSASNPVEMVDWTNAVVFCEQLTAKETAAGLLKDGQKYQLPTIEQWASFAANALTDASLAVFKTNQTAPVGSKKSNQYGLYDVRGNVREWTQTAAGNRLYQQVGGGYNSPVLGSIYSTPASAGAVNSNAGFRVILATESSLTKR